MSRRKKDPLRALTDAGATGVGPARPVPGRPRRRGRPGQAAPGRRRRRRLSEAARRAGRRSGDAVAHLVARFNAEGLAALTPRHGGADHPAGVQQRRPSGFLPTRPPGRPCPAAGRYLPVGARRRGHRVSVVVVSGSSAPTQTGPRRCGRPRRSGTPRCRRAPGNRAQVARAVGCRNWSYRPPAVVAEGAWVGGPAAGGSGPPQVSRKSWSTDCADRRVRRRTPAGRRGRGSRGDRVGDDDPSGGDRRSRRPG